MTARKTPAIPSLRTNTNKSATETTHTVPNSCVMSIHIVLPLPLIALPTTMFADFANRLILIKIRYIPHDAIILLSLVKSDMICCGNARQTPSVMIPSHTHRHIHPCIYSDHCFLLPHRLASLYRFLSLQ